MTDQLTKVKKTRTPKNEEGIFKAALGLSLKKKVDLVSELQAAITMEVDGLKAAAKQAEEIANGK